MSEITTRPSLAYNWADDDEDDWDFEAHLQQYGHLTMPTAVEIEHLKHVIPTENPLEAIIAHTELAVNRAQPLIVSAPPVDSSAPLIVSSDMTTTRSSKPFDLTIDDKDEWNLVNHLRRPDHDIIIEECVAEATQSTAPQSVEVVELAVHDSINSTENHDQLEGFETDTCKIEWNRRRALGYPRYLCNYFAYNMYETPSQKFYNDQFESFSGRPAYPELTEDWTFSTRHNYTATYKMIKLATNEGRVLSGYQYQNSALRKELEVLDDKLLVKVEERCLDTVSISRINPVFIEQPGSTKCSQGSDDTSDTSTMLAEDLYQRAIGEQTKPSSGITSSIEEPIISTEEDITVPESDHSDDIEVGMVSSSIIHTEHVAEEDRLSHSADDAKEYIEKGLGFPLDAAHRTPVKKEMGVEDESLASEAVRGFGSPKLFRDFVFPDPEYCFSPLMVGSNSGDISTDEAPKNDPSDIADRLGDYNGMEPNFPPDPSDHSPTRFEVEIRDQTPGEQDALEDGLVQNSEGLMINVSDHRSSPSNSLHAGHHLHMYEALRAGTPPTSHSTSPPKSTVESTLTLSDRLAYGEMSTDDDGLGVSDSNASYSTCSIESRPSISKTSDHINEDVVDYSLCRELLKAEIDIWRQACEQEPMNTKRDLTDGESERTDSQSSLGFDSVSYMTRATFTSLKENEDSEEHQLGGNISRYPTFKCQTRIKYDELKKKVSSSTLEIIAESNESGPAFIDDDAELSGFMTYIEPTDGDIHLSYNFSVITGPPRVAIVVDDVEGAQQVRATVDNPLNPHIATHGSIQNRDVIIKIGDGVNEPMGLSASYNQKMLSAVCDEPTPLLPLYSKTFPKPSKWQLLASGPGTVATICGTVTILAAGIYFGLCLSRT